ncbi:unnamed protein product, partial [Ranitomeya imitator]
NSGTRVIRVRVLTWHTCGSRVPPEDHTDGAGETALHFPHVVHHQEPYDDRLDRQSTPGLHTERPRYPCKHKAAADPRQCTGAAVTCHTLLTDVHGPVICWYAILRQYVRGEEDHGRQGPRLRGRIGGAAEQAAQGNRDVRYVTHTDLFSA